MISLFKNFILINSIFITINGLQLNYSGKKIGDIVEIKEKDEIIFSCSSGDNNISDISLLYPTKNYNVGLSVYEILEDNKTKTYQNLNATLADSGWYGCSDNEGNTKHFFVWVKSNDEKYLSVNATVHEFDALNMNITTTEEFVIAKLNERATLRVMSESSAKATVKWYHPKGYRIISLESNNKYVMNNNDISLSLSINNVQMSDGGNYTVKVQTSSFEKTICIPLIIKGIAVIETMNKSQNYFILNDKVRLNCKGTGFPSPVMHWSIKNQADDMKFVSSEKLVSRIETISTFEWVVIKSINVTCEAIIQNGVFTAEKMYSIFLVDVPNGFGVIKNEGILTAGDEFEVSCLASLDIYRDVNWYNENGTKVVSDNNIIINKNTTELSHCSTLFIKSVPKIKQIMYTCETIKTTNNTIERMNMNVTVYDELAPYFIDTNMNQSTVTYDSNVAQLIKLKCYAGGYPVPSITWLVNSKKIDDACEYNITHNNQELVIKNLYENCTGEYSCHVKNRVGEKTTFQVLELKKTYHFNTLHDILLLISVLIFAIIVIAVLLLIFYKKFNCNQSVDVSQFLNGLICDKKFIYLSDDVVLGEKLGCGEFGVVFRAEVNRNDGRRTIVAVKMVNSPVNKQNTKALFREFDIIQSLGVHINIVNALGICIKDQLGLCVLMEYCDHGNLHSFLLSKREKFIDQFDTEGRIDPTKMSDDKSTICTSDLIFWGFQVTMGMEHIKSKKIIHGDLATRNLLLTKRNIVKIADFGLSNNMYKKKKFHHSKNTLLPYKWLAIEAIKDNIYTVESDIWAFGITLWELFTLGDVPYSRLNDDNLYSFLIQGCRLRKPKYASSKIYEIMTRCWVQNPNERPLFFGLKLLLAEFLDTNTLREHSDLASEYIRDDFYNKLSENNKKRQQNMHDERSPMIHHHRELEMPQEDDAIMTTTIG